MAILETISNGFKATGNLAKALFWDNPIAKGFRFLTSALVGIPFALAACATAVPLTAALRVAAAASGKFLKFAGEQRVKTFNVALVNAANFVKNGTSAFLRNFCFYAPLTAISKWKEFSEKFTNALGSGRITEDDPHAPEIIRSYQEGGAHSESSQSIASEGEYEDMQLYGEEGFDHKDWEEKKEIIQAYQDYIIGTYGPTAPDLRASPDDQLKAAGEKREEISLWREKKGLPPTKFPTPISAIGQVNSGPPRLIS
jgi:hypothetical protein